MPDNPTGPATYHKGRRLIDDAAHWMNADIGWKAELSSEERIARRMADLAEAQVHATNANTAALVMLGNLIANATDQDSVELDAWAEAIPPSPLKRCWSVDRRRPECAERHTEDCAYADPVPEPKHELLPVGTRVLVSERARPLYHGDLKLMNPVAGKIVGYDMHKTKYRWQREISPGVYTTADTWAFMDEHTVVHPDGPECPPAPEPGAPTGPRIYVQNHHGKQGHITRFDQKEDGRVCGLVQWYTPGAEPVWRTLDTLTIIADSQVERCPNGQTRDECGTGENQCELCLQAEDEEGDMIEESMGLR